MNTVTVSRRRQASSLPRTATARISPTSAIYIRKIRGMGRGVFAGRNFRKGEVIEVCPVIPLPRRQERKCVGEILEKYIFHWPHDGHVAAIGLGYGSIYNHSSNANAKFKPRFATNDVVFRAARDIAVGEQILIDYEWEAADYHFPT